MEISIMMWLMQMSFGVSPWETSLVSRLEIFPRGFLLDSPIRISADQLESVQKGHSLERFSFHRWSVTNWMFPVFSVVCLVMRTSRSIHFIRIALSLSLFSSCNHQRLASFLMSALKSSRNISLSPLGTQLRVEFLPWMQLQFQVLGHMWHAGSTLVWAEVSWNISFSHNWESLRLQTSSFLMAKNLSTFGALPEMFL